MAEMKYFDRWRPGLQRNRFLRSSNKSPSPTLRPAPAHQVANHTNCDGKGGKGVKDSDVQGMIHPTKILVRNVKNLSRQEIYGFFSKFGVVMSVEKWVKSNTALVRFEWEAVASAVLKAPLVDLLFRGRQLVVEKRFLLKPLKPSQPQAPSVVDYTSSGLDPDVTSIHSLPEEILEHIFMYLSPKERIRTEMVCKYWRSLGKDLPWRSPSSLILDSDQNPDYFPLSDKMVSSILSRCGLTLKKLTLIRNISISFASLRKSTESIGRYCPNLVELKLDSVPVSNPDLAVLAGKCKKLKSVTFQRTDFSEESLSKFLNDCEMLECFSIGDNDNINGRCFESLGKNVKKLRINRCYLVNNTFGEILKSRCDRLEELTLFHSTRVEGDILMQVVHKYRQTLRVLHLNDCTLEIDWCACVKVLRNLEDLCLDECSKVDDHLLGVLVKNCRKLRALNVGATNVTDEGLYSLSSAPCLKVLDISYTDQVLGDGIAALAAQGKLEEVYIRSNLEVSDDMCRAFAEFCPNLRILDVSDAPEITNTLVDAFRSAIEKGVLTGPLKLIVGGTSITEDVQSCERLELDFENTSRRDLCSDIDDYSDDDSDFDYYSYNSGYDSYYDYDSDTLDNPFEEPFLLFW